MRGYYNPVPVAAVHPRRYIVTGARHYRGHEPGTRFVPRSTARRNNAPILRGDDPAAGTGDAGAGAGQLPTTEGLGMTETQGTRIAIKGVRPYDGEYELDLQRAWTTREWNWIKRISGYMPFTINEGLKGGDPDLFVALAVIGLVRNGKVERDNAMAVAETLLDVPYDGAAIQLVIEEEADDAEPPGLDERARRIVAQRNALEEQHFWGTFETEFGPIGREPVAYWDYRVGVAGHLAPADVGEATPSDLMAILAIYDATWKPE